MTPKEIELIEAGKALDMAIGKAVMAMTTIIDDKWTAIVLDILWPAQKLWRETVDTVDNVHGGEK